MALKGPDANNMVKMLLVGLVLLYLITSIIDFSALNSEDENAQIFKSNLNFNLSEQGSITNNVFQMLIVGMAIWLAWSFTIGFQGRFDRKKLISLIILGVILYFVYTNVLVGLIPGLPSLGEAAMQMQSMVG